MWILRGLYNNYCERLLFTQTDRLGLAILFNSRNDSRLQHVVILSGAKNLAWFGNTCGTLRFAQGDKLSQFELFTFHVKVVAGVIEADILNHFAE
jgi:hypothetical protein